ncbi:MAG: MFS transporter, partial [Gammaproteobacteria bacterium]|nr:MFS transporter [Gammaproteobacteria bacterium]
MHIENQDNDGDHDPHGGPNHDEEEVGGRYAKYVLVVLIVVYVFNFIDRQILSILAEEIKADLGISDADIGFLYGTAFAVFYAVFGIPLGRLADTWVRKNLISVGLGFWSLMTALSGTARSFAGLAVFRFGVGVGEASATPAAFSMLSDYFPPRLRATVLAIYSSGVYIGAGIGLFLGGVIVDSWNGAFPDPAAAPFGLKAWQAAFFAVGVPGLVMAAWVWRLKEPRRGMSEGLVAEMHPHPFREAGRSLFSVLPPFTLFSLLLNGGIRAAAINLLAAGMVAALAYCANYLTHTPNQWIALGIGAYSAISWVHGLKLSDPATFAMMFGSRTFNLISIGFPCIAFVTYGMGFWSAP